MNYFLNNVEKKNSFLYLTNNKYFVDKTKLIGEMNRIMDEYENQFVCITRPRRFGKSINAIMLASYYSKNLNTKDIFDKLNVSQCASYEEHLNKHNVIYISFNSSNFNFKTYDEYINYFVNKLIADIKEFCPDVNPDDYLSDMIRTAYEKTGEGFIFIIDEWDYIFDMNFSDSEKKNFLMFLTDILKDKSYVELAYMTGILPIAKHSSKSTLNMFLEFSALQDDLYGHFFGFTEEEVATLCKKQSVLSLEELSEWYNGYYLDDNTKIYNPRSIVCALKSGKCRSYWTNTGKMDDIIECVQKNVDSVKEDIVRMINGEEIRITLSGFSTEKMEFNTKEQIFSAMVILGFLSYHKKYLRIPNTELRMKFADSLKNNIFKELSQILEMADDMLNATLDRDTEKMSRILQYAHSKFSSVRHYNNESAIACVITLVYLTAIDEYEILREEPAGVGYADFIFKPRDKVSPAFIIELKKDKTVEEALQQIRAKNYAQKLDDCTGEKFAIGINYMTENTNKDDNRHHYVKIEELE